MDIQYLKSVGKYAVSIVLSLMIVLYILYHMSGGFKEDIETAAAELTAKAQTITINATVMRDETVVYSPVKGDVNYLFADGEKIPANSTVAEVYSSEGSDELRKSIIELDRKIRLLKSSNMSDTEKRTDTASTDKLIWNGIHSFLENAEDGNVSSASANADDISVQLNRRRIIVGSVKNYNSLIKELLAEKESLSSRLSSAESVISTGNAGYFYGAADGYENIFSSADIATLGYNRFLSMKDKEAENFSNTGKGYPIGKLVNDHVWYIACELEADQLHNFSTDSYYDVKFPHNGGTTINMYLYRVLSEVGSDTAVLILRTDVHPEGFSYLRNQTVQIVSKAYTGYRVPISAVRIENGVSGVYILRGSEVLFRKVETLFDYDGYFIVKERDEEAEDKGDWLNKNDFVIVKGKELYDGKIVD